MTRHDHTDGWNFLVLARPAKPLPEGVNVEGAADQWRELEEEGRADAYRIVEDDGYGFAVFLDVDDHDELIDILFKNPIGRWGEYEVHPLTSVEAEFSAMLKAGIISPGS